MSRPFSPYEAASDYDWLDATGNGDLVTTRAHRSPEHVAGMPWPHCDRVPCKHTAETRAEAPASPVDVGDDEVTATDRTEGIMGAVQFTKAVRRQKKARIALIGVTGGGKTLTALNLMRGMVGPEGRIAVIDTEHGSASLYTDRHNFDVLELTSFAPERYNEAIKAATAEGYDGLIIDSWSHAWAGKDGVLQFVDERAKQHRGSSFNAWGDATPKQNEMVEMILTAPLHVIVTMRAKMAYLQEKDERTGKTTIRKVGMQPVQREGVEYEFDLIGDMNLDNELIVTKTRCSAFAGKVIAQPGAAVGEALATWLSEGEAPPPAQERKTPAQATTLPALCKALAERDGKEKAAKFCQDVTGKASSKEWTAEDTAALTAQLTAELYGDGDPFAAAV